MKSTRLHPFRLPRPVNARLSNGLTVHVLTNRELPLVSAELSLCFGSAHEEPGALGLAGLLMRCLAADSMTVVAKNPAARLGSFAGEETSGLSFSCLTPQFAASFEKLAASVREPRLAEGQLEQVRADLISELTSAMFDASWLASRALSRAVWREHPYSNGARTTRAMFQTATRPDLLRFHSRHLGPDGAHLCIAGDVDPAATITRAERLFSAWRGAPVSSATALAFDAPPRAGQVLVIDRPDSEVAVHIGARGVRRGHPHMGAIAVLNAVMSEGFGSRLMSQLRTRRGLVYLVSTMFKSLAARTSHRRSRRINREAQHVLEARRAGRWRSPPTLRRCRRRRSQSSSSRLLRNE